MGPKKQPPKSSKADPKETTEAQGATEEGAGNERISAMA